MGQKAGEANNNRGKKAGDNLSEVRETFITMRNYNLNIAGYNIGFEASANGPDLKPSARFLRNINQKKGSDILIRVHSEQFKLPKGAERVFRAPYIEEINGIQFNNETNFWSVWKYRSELFIWTIFPLSSSEKNAVSQIFTHINGMGPVDLWCQG